MFVLVMTHFDTVNFMRFITLISNLYITNNLIQKFYYITQYFILRYFQLHDNRGIARAVKVGTTLNVLQEHDCQHHMDDMKYTFNCQNVQYNTW